MRSKTFRNAPSQTVTRVSVIFGLLMALAGAGCQSGAPISANAVPPALSGNDPGAQLEFWHTLPTRRLVSNDEAFRAMLLFVESSDDSADYAQRLAKMKSKSMLPDGFDEPAQAPARRGTVAVAMLKALAIRGGLTLQVFGPQPRYAVREMVYAGLFPPSSPQEIFSGAEFLGIMGRAEDYQRDGIHGTAVLSADEAGNGLLSAAPSSKLH